MPSSKFAEWIERHGKHLIFSALLVSSVTLAITVSIFTYAYLSRVYQQDDEVPLVTHKNNHMHLYTHNHDFHLPRKNSGLDGDYSNVISAAEHERPFFKFSKMDDLNLQQIDEYPYERGEIFREEGEPQNVIIENASPDEFRVLDDQDIHRKHSRKKHFQSRLREQNADTRQKGVDIVELLATTVPVTLKQHMHKPPGNPEPTTIGEINEAKLTERHHFDEHHSEDHTGESRHFADISDTPMTLYHVNNAVKAGAVCLDGSAPAYYHRPGSGSSNKLWIIHFNGGAWCFDAKACFERSQSSLGSTKKLPPSPPIVQGINSPDPSVNPDFYDWNLVWVVYCDGASFTGNRERPLISDAGETIYLRGKRVLNAIVNDLLYNRDFKLAEAIILTGSSAGSMTAMFQADYIASKFPKSIPVRVLSDAGFFIDTAPLGGKNLGGVFKKIYELQNSSAGLNQDCIRDVGQENGWQCFLPAKSARYVKTPMFILNSAYDVWALIYFDGIDCKFPSQEQKQRRRRRSIDQRLYLKSDSELDVSWRTDYTDLSMFRRETNDGKLRRDVSGFEIFPFFRNVDTKDSIPTQIPTVSDNVNVISINSQNNTTADHASNISAISYNSSMDVNKTSDYITPTENGREHKKKFTNFLKDIGTIATDNDMNLLFHALDANVTAGNDTNRNITAGNDTKRNVTIGNVTHKKTTLTMKTNLHKNDSKHSVARDKTKTKTFHDKKNVTKHILQKIDDNQPTVKSVIPSGDETAAIYSNEDVEETHRLDVIKETLKESLKSFVRKKSVLQKLDDKRNFNSSVTVKRHNLKSDDKTKRSTSIAKEYINILRSDPPECTEKELLNAMKYRGQLVHATDAIMRMPKAGRFLVSCIDHSLSLFDETWTGMIVKGKSIQQAFGDWFYERGNKEKHNLVDCPYPCNPTCS